MSLAGADEYLMKDDKCRWSWRRLSLDLSQHLKAQKRRIGWTDRFELLDDKCRQIGGSVWYLSRIDLSPHDVANITIHVLRSTSLSNSWKLQNKRNFTSRNRFALNEIPLNTRLSVRFWLKIIQLVWQRGVVTTTNERRQHSTSSPKLRWRRSTRHTDLDYLHFGWISICWLSSWRWKSLIESEKIFHQWESFNTVLKKFRSKFLSSSFGELYKTAERTNDSKCVCPFSQSFAASSTFNATRKPGKEPYDGKFVDLWMSRSLWRPLNLHQETNVRFSRWKTWEEKSFCLRGKESTWLVFGYDCP